MTAVSNRNWMNAFDPPVQLEGPASPIAVALAHFMFRPKRPPMMSLVRRRWRQEVAALNGQPFCVELPDGACLSAIRVPGDLAARQAASGPRLPVLLAHGWIEWKELHLERARRLSQAGHDVILYDHRCHGESTGRTVTFGYHERQDALALADDLDRRDWIPDGLINFGYSMGGTVMIEHAAMDPRVRGVIAVAPYYDLVRAVESYRLLHFARFNITRDWVFRGVQKAAAKHGFCISEVSAARAAAKLDVPTMFVIAGRDSLLPAWRHARPLARCVRHPRHVVELPEANHMNVLHGNWPGVHERIEAFCDRASRGQHLKADLVEYLRREASPVEQVNAAEVADKQMPSRPAISA